MCAWRIPSDCIGPSRSWVPAWVALVWRVSGGCTRSRTWGLGPVCPCVVVFRRLHTPPMGPRAGLPRCGGFPVVANGPAHEAPVEVALVWRISDGCIGSVPLMRPRLVLPHLWWVSCGCIGPRPCGLSLCCLCVADFRWVHNAPPLGSWLGLPLCGGFPAVAWGPANGAPAMVALVCAPQWLHRAPRIIVWGHVRHRLAELRPRPPHQPGRCVSRCTPSSRFEV